MSGQQYDGKIVVFSNGETLHFAGKSALDDALAYADEHETKVCVISTPETILRDLEGSRARALAEIGAKYPKTDAAYDAPEDRMLRGKGRLDLLERAEPAPRCWPIRLAFRRRQQSGDE